jgi:hypothetical protein
MKHSKFFYLIILSALFLIVSCHNNVERQIVKIEDNSLIVKLHSKDIQIRELDFKTDTVNLENYDKIHREKTFELLANNQVKTPMDKYRAALILQHTAAKICDGQLTSLSPENFLLAFHLSSSALNELKALNDSITIKKECIPRMVALNYDRFLLFSVGYQKYGTQFVFDDVTGDMLLAPINTTLTNDEDRKQYQVETLEQLLTKYKMKPLPKD